jgi:hypothetical protein
MNFHQRKKSVWWPESFFPSNAKRHHFVSCQPPALLAAVSLAVVLEEALSFAASNENLSLSSRVATS